MRLPGVETPIMSGGRELAGLISKQLRKHFGCGAVRESYDANEVLKALSEGHPVYSSQHAGLFTRGGHFIVLRGVENGNKVLVNDPNDSEAKNYINRSFDMASEVDITSDAYFIFESTGPSTK